MADVERTEAGRWTAEAYYKGFRLLITIPYNNGGAIAGFLDKMIEAGFTPTSNGVLYQAPTPEVPTQSTSSKENLAPTCPKHGVSMVKRKGQYGEFWACPIKTDGEWCHEKPPKAKS